MQTDLSQRNVTVPRPVPLSTAFAMQARASEIAPVLLGAHRVVRLQTFNLEHAAVADRVQQLQRC